MDKAYQDNQTRQLALDLSFIPVVPPKSNRLEPWQYDLDPDTLPISPPAGPDDVQRYLNDLEAIEKQVRPEGVTIGPTAPPASFAPDQFLITIENYKETAVKQGWITNPGVVNSLDVKLNTALSALQKQDTTTAKNVLNALLNEVNAQSSKHLTSEAVAFYNLMCNF